METMAATPTASVPKACNVWGETMAAYRVSDNASVDWQAILEPHGQQTEQRMAGQEVVLCLQDTTELDFNGQQARGLGPLSSLNDVLRIGARAGGFLARKGRWGARRQNYLGRTAGCPGLGSYT